jgi:hypothetical protein
MEESPLATLRQLKEMLDAGAITPSEFDALKQKLVFGGSSPAAPGAAGLVDAAGQTLTPPTEPATEPAAPQPVVPAPVVPAYESVVPTAVPVDASPPAPAEPLIVPPLTAGFPPVPPAPTPEPEYAEPAPYGSELEEPAKRNPLNLILSIGGLLALLGLVIYLSFNNRSSERLTSTSQTAADSIAAPLETGPQAEQIELPAQAVPETVRVAPTNPAPPITPKAAPAPVLRDSAAAAPAAAPTDSAGK